MAGRAKALGDDSLASFDATIRTSREGCTICELPEAEELNRARREAEALRARSNWVKDGISTNTMHRWLVEKKGRKDVTLGRLRSHFDRGHHRERA